MVFLPAECLGGSWLESGVRNQLCDEASSR
jgi:hypothetical protein